MDDQTNPKDLLGIKKPQIDLVPPILEILTSLAFRDGAIKYGPYNWRVKKVRFSIYYAAIKRHLAALWDGEDRDPISGVPHIAHAAACIAIIMDAHATGNLMDDRPMPGPSSKTIESWTIKEEPKSE